MPRISAAATLVTLAASASPLWGVAAISEDCQAGDGECPAVARPEVQRENLLLQVAGKKPPSLAQEPGSWRSSGRTSGNGQWCKGAEPADGWDLKACSADGGNAQEVKILTYNLYWWNLFGHQFQNGNGGSAGKLIGDNNHGKPFDFMGFQECEDVGRVLRDGGLDGEFAGIVGDHAVAMAYRKGAWEVLGHGMDEVAEDRPDQWYGKRGAMWARFRSLTTGKKVLFVNHHGPLPVGTGGKCGRHATAWNLLKTIAMRSQKSDGIILVGDFNADADTLTVKELEHRFNRVYTGKSFGGVDHVFSNCGGSRVISRKNLGDGGSDHDALEVVLQLEGRFRGRCILGAGTRRNGEVPSSIWEVEYRQRPAWATSCWAWPQVLAPFSCSRAFSEEPNSAQR
eukprot:CAMPEP_0176100950 /NCGR_PEP_ID=MMETSP0120_2-20121206/50634_1 /TAXON_ID=160619 /ORGANISM="Kryptoperidinium foliaceum, Strain CCMP 1326" /LENGTH=396 /DNA_ID=CAMNT_0017435001 /DNA_START=20 /DNA_END=1208 /DNA_ORIENTATION=+